MSKAGWDVLGVVAVGGALGATARYAAGLAWPVAPGAFPWSTFMVNLVGCALIGTLLVLITELWTVHRLVRPFAGTGVLGGFTTFSTYAVEIELLVTRDAAVTGLLYLVATPVAALAATWLATILTRSVTRGRMS